MRWPVQHIMLFFLRANVYRVIYCRRGGMTICGEVHRSASLGHASTRIVVYIQNIDVIKNLY